MKNVSRLRTPEASAPSVLDEVSASLSPIAQAIEFQKQVAKAGFEWPSVETGLAYIREETDELEEELIRKTDEDAIEAELGDLFFSVLQVASYLGVDPETALRRTNHKFDKRIRYIENALAHKGLSLRTSSLAEKQALWREAKKA